MLYIINQFAEANNDDNNAAFFSCVCHFLTLATGLVEILVGFVAGRCTETFVCRGETVLCVVLSTHVARTRHMIIGLAVNGAVHLVLPGGHKEWCVTDTGFALVVRATAPPSTWFDGSKCG
jgi:hypothetical protein